MTAARAILVKSGAAADLVATLIAGTPVLKVSSKRAVTAAGAPEASGPRATK